MKVYMVVTERMDEDKVNDWIAAITETTTKEDAKERWREGNKACAALDDLDAAERIKAALLAHAEKIDADHIADAGNMIELEK